MALEGYFNNFLIFTVVEFVCEWKINMNAVGGRMIEQQLKYPENPDGCFRHCKISNYHSTTNGLRYGVS